MQYFLWIAIFIGFSSVHLSAQNSQKFEQEVFQKTNAYRTSKNLPPLIWNTAMTELAHTHSAVLAEQEETKHSGASQRFEALREIYPGMTAFGENVAFNFGFSNPVDQALKGWLKNPKHRGNILGDFTHTGIGVFVDKSGKIYFTQIFGKITDESLEKTSSKNSPPHNKQTQATFIFD
ncbi:MAG: CAP domain-containing protein [Verrucomicrobiota bacterium]